MHRVFGRHEIVARVQQGLCGIFQTGAVAGAVCVWRERAGAWGDGGVGVRGLRGEVNATSPLRPRFARGTSPARGGGKKARTMHFCPRLRGKRRTERAEGGESIQRPSSLQCGGSLKSLMTPKVLATSISL